MMTLTTCPNILNLLHTRGCIAHQRGYTTSVYHQQKCSTRVQDLDSSPVFLGFGFGLGLDTSGLELDFQGIFYILA